MYHANKQSTVKKIGMYIYNLICCCCKKDLHNSAIFKTAPEPTDVYWEHLEVSDIQRFFYTIITYFISFILVCICFVIIYLLTVAKNDYTNKHKNDPKSLVNIIASNVIGVVISLVITLINMSLRIVVR